ncbi:CDC42 small effector protein Spec2 isoform X2 [Ptiloglossa arizonensis]|uniref:CDC42 small effector protein Spec2 isoform X2 n=1 Tax=Ptiloglossa arizonensis TaxID=3350558 RepID=UPI003FA0F104
MSGLGKERRTQIYIHTLWKLIRKSTSCEPAHAHSSIKRECLFCFSLLSSFKPSRRLDRTTVRSLDDLIIKFR